VSCSASTRNRLILVRARNSITAPDEGLDILEGLWSGEPFSYQGEEYQVDDAAFLPRPVQQPRPRITGLTHLNAGATASNRHANRVVITEFSYNCNDGEVAPKLLRDWLGGRASASEAFRLGPFQLDISD